MLWPSWIPKTNTRRTPYHNYLYKAPYLWAINLRPISWKSRSFNFLINKNNDLFQTVFDLTQAHMYTHKKKIYIYIHPRDDRYDFSNLYRPKVR